MQKRLGSQQQLFTAIWAKNHYVENVSCDVNQPRADTTVSDRFVVFPTVMLFYGTLIRTQISEPANAHWEEQLDRRKTPTLQAYKDPFFVDNRPGDQLIASSEMIYGRDSRFLNTILLLLI